MTRVEAFVARIAAASAAVQRTALAVFAALVFLPGLVSLPVSDRDEARFVQASRQMIESGDPIDIRFQDEARYKKPVGIYWMQVAAMEAVGQGADAPLWASRLPSYLAAIAAVVLVQVVGVSLTGAAPALLGAILFAGTLVLAGEARIAKTDAVLLALVLVQMAVLARAYSGTALGQWRVYAFWAAFGLSALVKGPVGPMIVGLSVLALCLVQRDRNWLRPIGNWRAMALGAAILLPWAMAISWRAGGEFWQASVGGDLLAKVAEGQEGKGAPPGTYLALLWLTFWPGSALLTLMLPAIWADRRAKASIFLLAWIIPFWLVLEAVPTKLIHYPLPLYPALALLACAALMARPAGALPPLGRAVALPFLALAPLLLGASAWLAASTGAGFSAAWPAVLALPPVLVVALAACRALTRDLRHALPACLAVMAAITLAGAVATLARTPWLWPSDQLAALIRDATPEECAETRLVSTGYTEPSLIVRTSRQTQLLPVDRAAKAAGQACTLIAVEDRVAPEFARATTDVPLEQVGRVQGFAIGAGRNVGVTLYRNGGAE
ncbi:MAG: glycosyl transferase [Cereibacter sphaeroides]|uniref:Glycosyl transferase n=1 Tax=Cereibacter sphaeroides TaxID=1063 RepID=A0A2W5SG84_CERSP|nr:MAG: glycosyl transferase [Cereibacter sphaeroides]